MIGEKNEKRMGTDKIRTYGAVAVIYGWTESGRGFGKTESYCLLKMMNDYDLFWIQPDENLKEELDDDITRYCAIVGKEKFDKLKDAEKIAELKN